MKFILPETSKYILKEDLAKFILDERFILLEDEGVVNALNQADANNSTAAPETNNGLDASSLEKFNAVSLNQLKRGIEDIKNAQDTSALAKVEADLKEKEKVAKRTLGIKADYSQMADDVNEYIKVFEEAAGIDKIKDTTEVLGTLNQLKRQADKNVTKAKTDKEIDTLELYFSKFVAAVDAALKGAPENAIITNCDKIIELIDKINAELNTDDDSIRNKLTPENINNYKEIIEEFLNTLKEIQLPEEAPTTNDFETIYDNLQKLDNACTSVASKLANAKASKELADAEKADLDAKKAKLKQEVEANKTKKDWKTLLVKAGSDTKKIREIWEDYYKTEWGKNAQKVSQLGEAFTQELLQLGFSGNSNPFVVFIKNNINNLNLNKNTYSAIHNAYVHDYISDDELKGGNSIYGISPTTNILYCKNLYSNSAQDIVQYLNLQNQVDRGIHANKLKEIFTDNLDTVNKVVTVIFTKDYNIEDDPELKGAALVDNTAKALKTVSAVDEQYQIAFGESGLQKKEKADGEELFKKIGTGRLQDAVQYLVITQNTDGLKLPQFISEYKNKDGASVEVNRIDTDPTEMLNMKRIFDSTDIGPQNIQRVLGDLLTAAGYTKEKK